ncbi:di-heme oxidoredictase family protein [Roseibium suaedae]|uniref:Di-haem oxidoreductase, putative peroxidase n=1 Tax=Roseibium suaedae TaxID=735517 RepID=A0A1M6YTX3_9HYPH|nr:di-heme oxidoredictase family protein [Roseibium suaedae]SHL21784.1 Di-haem oxidoreductase, putative peroxidase [Roseibium suaedae]
MRKVLFSSAIFLSLSGTIVLADEDRPGAAPYPWDETVVRELDFDTTASRGPDATQDLIDLGQRLFEGKFTVKEGAGRPEATQAIVPTKRRRPSQTMFQRMAGLDANACSSCHNVPFSGGAGDFTANVFVSEGFESADFDTSDPQFSNERGTNSMFGAGLIELLAREMTADLRAQRSEALKKARADGAPVTQALETKGVPFGKLIAHPDGSLDVSGVEGIDHDLTLRPFSQKGVFASLRQFTVNAMNQHHGMEAEERFGTQWTGTADFDGDEVEDELSRGQISALVAWQATLPAPGRKKDLPAVWQDAAAKGEELFARTGCTECHRHSLPLDSLTFLDPGPYEGAGTLRPTDVKTPIAIDFSRFDWVKALPRDEKGRVLVPLFGDLKRHRIADAARDTLGNELLSQRFVDRDVFLTAELWGIGSTAPYGHRGDLTTLDEVIEAHGGEATEARKTYSALDEGDKQSIIAFLRSLEITQ